MENLPAQLFSWLDYTLFCCMMGVSVLIGMYFGFCGKQDTPKDYLLGGKTMKTVPIAVSLIASHISGITILAVPADVYVFGSNYWWCCIAMILVCIVKAYIYLPVLFKLQRPSMFEYLNIRFDKKVRTFGSLLFNLSILFYNPVVIYIPALAFSQATAVSLHLIAAVTCIICIFYTTIGGLKAVVWTDTLQFFGIVGSIIAIFIIGLSSVGGFQTVWYKSTQSQRLDLLNFSIDPTMRDGFWIVVVGGTLFWTGAITCNQGYIQKCLAVPTLKCARKAIAIYCIGVTMIITMSVAMGNIMYARYSDCDPLSTKQVSRTDQMLPYFVMDVAGNVPGLPGVFIAGVFCAALSTLSSTLNTLSCTIYNDIILPFMHKNTSERVASNILKCIVVACGLICIASVFIIEQMEGMLPFITTAQGITSGPLLGLFTLGILFPLANARGALYGGVSGLIFIAWIAIGNQWYKSKGLIKTFAKPVSISECSSHFNMTTVHLSADHQFPMEEPFVLYRITFWYYTAISTIVVVTVGLIVSWFTRKNNDKQVEPDLISPIVLYLFAKLQSPSAYLSVNKALYEMTQQNCEQ